MHHSNPMLVNLAKYDYKAKEKNLSSYNAYTLIRTLSMFEWDNLPDTIPLRQLELLLQTVGYAFIAKHKGKLYAFYGGLGGVPDPYGYPTEIAVSNPALNFSKTFKLTEGVLIHNDDLDMGLMPLMNRYNSMLVENDINMVVNGFNTRTQRLISVTNDKSKQSADAYLEGVIKGDISSIADNALFDSLKLHSGSSEGGSTITAMIENQQYLKASLFNELGLSDNYNMKRERLTEGETEAGDDSNFTLIYNMFKNRYKACELINEKFGTDLSVDFGSVWDQGRKEVIDDEVHENIDTEIETPQSILDNIDNILGGERDQSLTPETETETETDNIIDKDIVITDNEETNLNPDEKDNSDA